MQRRKFIRQASFIAVGVGVFGNIKWKDDHFEGVEPTTSDILGPFYRPGAPMRSNVIPKDVKAEKLQLSGIIFKDDGKTPYNNCLVEIWQCSPDGVYDNTSDEFKFRGAQKTGADGKYHFITTIPVSYLANASSNSYRPAHIHMRISGKGEQDLVTQIYFKNDPYLETDSASSAPQAIHRILEIKKNNKNENAIQFDIVMAKEFKLEDAAFAQITGLYETDGKTKVEFIRSDDILFVKLSGQLDDVLYYKGNNSFKDALDTTRIKFEPQQNGETKITGEFLPDPKKTEWVHFTGKRILKYN
jgi:protocatechuate 3,4-dioxygenase beta subunit